MECRSVLLLRTREIPVKISLGELGLQIEIEANAEIIFEDIPGPNP